MTITVAELLAALADAETLPEPGIPPYTFSGTQIMDAMKWGHTVYHRHMTRWLAEGVVKRVRVRKEALDGRMSNVTNFQFVVPPKFATAAPKKQKRAA